MQANTIKVPTKMSQESISSKENFKTTLQGLELPEWIHSLKEKSWESFSNEAMPTRTDEAWRFTNLKALNLEPYTQSVSTSNEESCNNFQQTLPIKTSGSAVFIDDFLKSFTSPDEKLQEQGIIFCSFEDAYLKHPQLLQEFLFSEENQLSSKKLSALHKALFRNGVLIYIPENTVVEEPFLVQNLSKAKDSSIFPNILMIGGRNSKATLIENNQSLNKEAAFTHSMTHLFAGEGSNITRQTIHNWNQETKSFYVSNVIAGKDAHVQTVDINLGSTYSRLENQSRIIGSGASVNLHSLSTGFKDQQFDQRTLQIHEAPNGKSDLLYKNVLNDKSHTIFSGLIKVDEKAQKTDAYQKNRNLILSNQAEANSLPGLEIEANDVRCSHGATSSQIDEELIFYLLNRGISRPNAKKLLTLGFLEEVLTSIENKDVFEYIHSIIEEKFSELKS